MSDSVSQTASVLVVDDVPNNLLAMHALLTRPGLEVLTAASGIEALELLLVHDVALALVDLNMPEMSGFELAEILRSNPRTRAIPLIFITAGSEEPRLAFEGYRAGAVDFLHKPFDPDILRSKVEVFVDLHNHRKSLAQRLKELQAALQEQREAEEALREADRRKDEFMAMLAHELRNPLAPIRSALDLFEILAPDNAVLVDARMAASRQVEHMTSLVNDLLDTARVSRGKIRLRKELCDFSRVVADTVDDYRASLAAEQIQLHLELPAQPLLVDGDPTRLAQCIGNLLHNACKFSSAGSTITVRAFETSGAAGKPMALVQVQDSGCGMNADMLAQAFTPFSQGNQEPSRGDGGLGLGLALVKGLVELHGGTVSAASEGVGKGSCFSIGIPLARGELAGTRQQPAASREEPVSLLVIDDNRDYLHTMEAALSAHGHRVRIAEDSAAGLAAARDLVPDTILCDLGLPGELDGYAIARALREDPRFDGTMLIAVSGYGSQADKQRAREAGFDAHFAKPVSIARLPLRRRQGRPDDQRG